MSASLYPIFTWNPSPFRIHLPCWEPAALCGGVPAFCCSLPSVLGVTLPETFCPEVEGLAILVSNSGSLGGCPEEEAAVSWKFFALAKGSWVVLVKGVDWVFCEAWGCPWPNSQPQSCWLGTPGGLFARGGEIPATVTWFGGWRLGQAVGISSGLCHIPFACSEVFGGKLWGFGGLWSPWNELLGFCCLKKMPWLPDFEGSRGRFGDGPCLDWAGFWCCFANNFSALRARAFCRFASIFFLCYSVRGNDILIGRCSCRNVSL